MQLLQNHHEHVWLYSVPRQLWRWQVPLRVWRRLIRDVHDMRQQLRQRQVQVWLLRPQRWHMHQLRLVWSRQRANRLQLPQPRHLLLLRIWVSYYVYVCACDSFHLSKHVTHASSLAPSHTHTQQQVQDDHVQLALQHMQWLSLWPVPHRLRRQQPRLVLNLPKLQRWQVQDRLHWPQRGDVHQLRQQLRFWTVPRAVLVPEPRPVRVVPIVPGWTAACRLQLPRRRHM